MIKRKSADNKQEKFQSYPENWDFSLSGKRIQLIKTLDPYTKLKPNDLGTIEYVIRNKGIEDQISIQWDSGSSLMLLIGLDNYIVLDEKGVIEIE